LPSGTYHLFYTLNGATKPSGTSSVMIYDSAGALLVSRSQCTITATSDRSQLFVGSVVKMYPAGTTLTIGQTGLAEIQAGSVFVHKLQ
jgi:hypothetical protein